MNMRRTFNYTSPKAVFYSSDGTGRDTYISINNGGMTSRKPFSGIIDSGKIIIYLGAFLNDNYSRIGTQSIGPKYFYYHSDGTGRDTYVVYVII